MSIRWDPRKSERLKRTRGVSFEEIIQGRQIAIQEHPKRPNQKLLLFELQGYIWSVPYVTTGREIFLKTAYPSRVYTKKWLRGELK